MNDGGSTGHHDHNHMFVHMVIFIYMGNKELHALHVVNTVDIRYLLRLLIRIKLMNEYNMSTYLTLIYVTFFLLFLLVSIHLHIFK